MNEQALLSYFSDEITAAELNNNVEGSEQRTSHDVFSVAVTQIRETDGFHVSSQHLIKLCDDAINGSITLKNLNIIAYALIFSEYFYWDTNTKDGEIIGQTIDDWDNTEIGHTITIENLLLWKEYLERGIYNLKIKNK